MDKVNTKKKRPTTPARQANPGKPEKFTTDQVIKAILEAHGLLSDAARRLHCSRTTLYRYIAEHPEVAEAREEADESTKDLVEGKLLNEIKKGNVTAIIFYLKTKAKDRGYIERQEHSGPDGQPLQAPQVIEIIKTYEAPPGEDKETGE